MTGQCLHDLILQPFEILSSFIVRTSDSWLAEQNPVSVVYLEIVLSTALRLALSRVPVAQYTYVARDWSWTETFLPFCDYIRYQRRRGCSISTKA